MKNDENDFVELQGEIGKLRRFFEDSDGWWRLEGGDEGWEFSADERHGFLTSFRPPQGSSIELGTNLATHRGRHLVVASIRREAGSLMMILMHR
jgi:hypothetical protein